MRFLLLDANENIKVHLLDRYSLNRTINIWKSFGLLSFLKLTHKYLKKGFQFIFKIIETTFRHVKSTLKNSVINFAHSLELLLFFNIGIEMIYCVVCWKHKKFLFLIYFYYINFTVIVLLFV